MSLQELFVINLQHHMNGIGQRKLALAAGVSQGHISRILRGHSDCTLVVLERLALALDVEPTVLLERN